MALSPIKLLDYIVEEFHFCQNHDFNPSLETDLSGFDIVFNTANHEKDKKRKRYRLTVVQAKENNKAYYFEITITGFFEIERNYAKGKAPKEVDRIANINCPSMLYAAARDIILMFSLRGGREKVLIPSVNFSAFVDEAMAEDSESSD